MEKPGNQGMGLAGTWTGLNKDMAGAGRDNTALLGI
jgi:hypothetical protein